MEDKDMFGQSIPTRVHNIQTNPDQLKRETHIERAARKAGEELHRRLSFYDYRIQPASGPELEYRHASWAHRRALVRDALLRTGMSENRRYRFDNCGSDCVVEFNAKEGRHRCRANYCGDRFCEPCARQRSNTMAKNIAGWMAGGSHRFMTLTQAPEGRSFSDLQNHAYASFTRLRASQLWKRAVRGGCGTLEAKVGRDGKSFHVHLHLIVFGSYIDKEQLSAAWRVASKGSYVVDIRKVADNEGAARYLTKYVSKGFDASIVESPAHLDECICGLRGRRVFFTFGLWHGRRVERPISNREDWQRVERLQTVLFAAWRGEQWANGILLSLRGKTAGEDEDARAGVPRSTVAGLGTAGEPDNETS